MKITNYQERDKADERREIVQGMVDKLYTELAPLERELNDLESDIDDYDREQSALDE